MIREVVLETAGHDEWTSVIKGSDVNVRIVGCRPYGENGMLQFVMVNSNESVRKTLRAIKSHPNVLRSEMSLNNDHRASGIIVTNYSPLCRTLAQTSGFCMGCFFTQRLPEEGKWRIVLAGKVSLDTFVRQLQKQGIPTSVKHVERMKGNSLLTFEQESVMRLAETKGYFSIPKMMGIRELSGMLGMAPSTLDEVLRRAERKVVESYLRESNGHSELAP